MTASSHDRTLSERQFRRLLIANDFQRFTPGSQFPLAG